MSNLDYPLEEWKLAYDQAEIASFKDGPDLHDFPLSQFMCGIVDNNVKAGQDPRIISGAIDALEKQGFDGVSPDMFVTVLGTANGTTTDDFQELVHDFQDDTGFGPNPEDMIEPSDWQVWYNNNAKKPTEAFGEVTEGGTLFWFDRKNIW
jgi:hypothetical protein